MKVGVFGGSLSGLAVSAMLADRGFDVFVVDPAGFHLDASDDQATAWEKLSRRRWAFRQVHALSAPGYQVLQNQLPDVADDLISMGAREFPLDMLGRCALRCRRSTLELAMQRGVARRPVRVCLGRRATKLVAHRRNSSRIDQVVLNDGTTQRVEFVIDATGASEGLRTLLADRPVRKAGLTEDTGFSYATQWFHGLSDDYPVKGERLEMAFGFLTLVPADCGWISATLVLGRTDPLLKEFGRTTSFSRLLEASGVGEAVASCHAAGTPSLARMLQTQQSKWLLTGFDESNVVPIGDAMGRTSPVQARGMGIALVTAHQVAEALAEHHSPEVSAERFHAWSTAELLPWFRHASLYDKHLQGRYGARVCNGHDNGAVAAVFDDVQLMLHDGEFLRSWIAYLQTIGRPDDLEAAWVRRRHSRIKTDTSALLDWSDVKTLVSV